MTVSKSTSASVMVAVYTDRDLVELALHTLHEHGFDMRDMSVVGRGFESREVPRGVVSTGDVAEAGAELGAVAGGICGLLLGTAFLVVPFVGPVFVAGPFAAALAGAAEGALAGAVVGGMAGALVGWGIPAVHVRRYETQLNEGKFLLLVRGDAEELARARALLAPITPGVLESYASDE